MCSTLAILPLCAVLLSILSFILQLIALPSDEWGHFVTRRLIGVPEERGHFGFWRLCSTETRRDQNAVEGCVHPGDSPYQFPIYASSAGAFSIVHLLLVASFVILACIRVLQIARESPDLYLGTRRLCMVKASLALICVVVSITVSILASIGEGKIRKFIVYKGWAFWVQIFIISIDIVLLLVCAFENIQYWQIRMAEPPPRDATDEHPETFVTPDYDLPPALRKDRVVYVKDAGVQSQLDGYDGCYLQVPGAIYGRGEQNQNKSTKLHVPEGRTNSIRTQGSPHPRKKIVI